jgi:uncharacterized protein YodC (DUF2158 family)
MSAEPNITKIERKTIGVGSIVMLKSGGPNMVVSERSSESAQCYWHTDNGECHFSWLPLRVLELKT